MQVIKSEMTSFWDIDGTLIVGRNDEGATRNVSIPDPLDKTKYIVVSPNDSMIRLMREERHRGAFIVVWSRGGHEWAESVIKALNLVELVDVIMSKPMAYFDDKDVSEWLPYRVFLKPTSNYKR